MTTDIVERMMAEGIDPNTGNQYATDREKLYQGMAMRRFDSITSLRKRLEGARTEIASQASVIAIQSNMIKQLEYKLGKADSARQEWQELWRSEKNNFS